MTHSKRDTIKARIIEAQDRDDSCRVATLAQNIQSGAIDAKDKLTAFAKEHPVLTVAGGLALGIAAAAIFKVPRRAAIKGGLKAASLAGVGSELALAFASQMIGRVENAGKAGARKADELGGTITSKARSIRKGAVHNGEDALDFVQGAGRQASRHLSKLLTRQ